TERCKRNRRPQLAPLRAAVPTATAALAHPPNFLRHFTSVSNCRPRPKRPPQFSLRLKPSLLPRPLLVLYLINSAATRQQLSCFFPCSSSFCCCHFPASTPWLRCRH